MTPDQEKEFFQRDFVLQGRMFHPYLTEMAPQSPEDIAQGKKPRYKLQFAWPKNSPANAQAMQAINAFIAEAKQRIFPQIPDQIFVWPIKDFDTYMRQDGRP